MVSYNLRKLGYGAPIGPFFYDVTSIEIYPLIALPIEMALQIG